MIEREVSKAVCTEQVVWTPAALVAASRRAMASHSAAAAAAFQVEGIGNRV
jgi:hypothetical protein